MDHGRTFKERLTFLFKFDPHLADLLLRAAQLQGDDPTSAAVVLRSYGEEVVRHILKGSPTEQTFFAALVEIRQLGVPKAIVDKLHDLREIGNRGAHPSQFVQEMGPVVEHIRKAWAIAEWLHVRAGRRPEDVPIYEPPSPADGNAIFREAILGGAEGLGDPVAKYYVAKAILAQTSARIRDIKSSNSRYLYYYPRSAEVEALFDKAAFFVPAARTELAKLYLYDGEDPPKRLDQAKELLDWAIEADESEALFLVGVFYRDAQFGYPRDLAKSMDYWERAAAVGDPRAYNAMAYLLRGSEEVEQSPERARDFARKSADAGYPSGQYQYGEFLLTGFGGPTSKDAGLLWIRRSANQGWPLAMFHLATLILDGKVEAAHSEDAEALLDGACREECVEALLWRADRELSKDNHQAAFGSAFPLLWSALSACQTEEGRSNVRATLKRTFERLNAYLLRLPQGSLRHQDLAQVWFQCNKDGTRKFSSTGDMASQLFQFEPGVGLTKESQLNLLRMMAGPGFSDHEIRQQFETIMTSQTLGSRFGSQHTPKLPAAFATKPAKVGRNDMCPCKSGKKYKKCHGQ